MDVGVGVEPTLPTLREQHCAIVFGVLLILNYPTESQDEPGETVAYQPVRFV